MGLEAKCRARWNGEETEGKLQLETGELRFRGGFRLTVPLQGAAVEARGGELVVLFAGGEAVFTLGPESAKWAEKIRNPKGRLDKLGVKAGMRIALAGTFEEEFLQEIRARVGDTASGASERANILFFAADAAAGLAGLPDQEAAIERDGAIWVVYPKGRKEITEAQVLGAIKAAGLVDTKVCAFSATHTALKAVIPVSRRIQGRNTSSHPL